MHLTYRNVNDAFHNLVKMFHSKERQSEGDTWQLAGNPAPIVSRPSRNGPVLMIDEPVTITYTHPRERVLFNIARDANPFFHLYEALWMLAGRNDVASVAYYAKQMREYSDDDETLNGAYGYRWRHAQTRFLQEQPRGKVDQLDILVNHLKAKPDSRRAALQMWNVEDDLLKIDSSKDTCCNLSVMFSIRHQDDPKFFGPDLLDMTVTNRSNDMIWGALGANYVHFTFLQEYMAAKLGVEVGRYHHFTNNLHVYEWNWKPEAWLANPQEMGFHVTNPDDWGAQYRDWNVVPLVKDAARFDAELPRIVDRDWEEPPFAGEWSEPFFVEVADPMFRAFYMHKNKDYSASLYWVDKIAADDWRTAARSWITKRKEKHDCISK